MATTVKELVATFGLQTNRASFSKGQQAVDQIKTAAKGLVTLFAAGAVARGFTSMIERASDAAESMNVIGAAFGENQQQVLDWSATTAAAVGRSEFKLREMAASLGALVQPMVKDRKAAADMSTQLSTLAVDLGSFFNTTDEDALIALRAGLVGSTEPLLKYGVNLQVAQLQSFALSKGISKSVIKMTQAEKATLRYQAILAQTANAQGDAAKTSEGYANATKALQAGLVDLSTRIGQSFLPSAERTIRSLRTLVASVSLWVSVNEEVIKSRIDKFMQTIEQVVSNLATFFGRVAVSVRAWFDGLSDAQMMMVKVASVALLLAAVLLLPGASILLLIGLIGLLIDDFETWRAGGKSVIGDLLGDFDKLEEAFPRLSTAVEALSPIFQSVFGGIGDFIFAQIQFWIDAFDVGFVQAAKNLLTNLVDSGFGQFFRDIHKAMVFGVNSWVKVIWKGITGVFERIGKWVKENSVIGSVVSRVAGAAGAIAGGGGATEVMRSLTGAGASTVSPGSGSGGFSNQQSNKVSVSVQAGANESDESLANRIGEVVVNEMEAQNRAALDALTAGSS